MQIFVMRELIAKYERYLEFETAERCRRALQKVLVEARRELALLEASSLGAQAGPPLLGQAPDGLRQEPLMLRRFRDELESAAKAFILLDPRAGLHIVEANRRYRELTLTDAGIAGQPMFDVFPDNPDDPAADGVSNLFASLRRTVSRGTPQAMRTQRYDVRAPEGGFALRYWRPTNTPIYDANGRLLYVLHYAEDITAEVLAGAGHHQEAA